MKQRLLEALRKHWPLLAVALIFWGLGMWMGGGSKGHPHTHAPPTKRAKGKKGKKVIWSCSMHPQIRMPKPGKCPICFMDLTPLSDEGGQASGELRLSKAGKALAELRTEVAVRRPVFLSVRMLGRVAYDETRIKLITAWVPGRLERLFVDYTGVPVRKGDHLVRIYSPDLLAAQQELLQATRAYASARKSGHASLVVRTAKLALDSARRKLELLGLRRWQLRRILRKGKPSLRINIYAPMGGIVIQKKAMEGMYVKTGSHIYTIADLSQVWIRFDAYERDLPWLHVGQKATFTTQATPGQEFSGTLVYIDPMLNPKTRTVGVRVNAKNVQGLLKPGMFVRGRVQVSLNAKGRAQAPVRSGKWVCPMHPEVVRKKRSSCRICGMRLERIAAPRRTHPGDPLVIPASAPLLTGKRAIVYVEKPKAAKPTYTGREVLLGPKAGRYYVVLKGLKEGERVVSQGAFRLDSELQLRARPSMMSASAPPKPAKKSPRRLPTPAPFLRRLRPLFADYFALQSALAGDRPKLAYKAYGQMFRFVGQKIPAPRVAKLPWEKLRSQLYDALKAARLHRSLKPQREAFEAVARAMILLDQRLGHEGMASHYLAYCPMAFNNRGAAWLQPNKQILNPYFGAKMLRCGTIRKAILGRDAEPVAAPTRFLKRLTPWYEAYLRLQDHLFRDQDKPAAAAAKALVSLLKPSLHRLLPRGLRKRWKGLQRSLLGHAKAAAAARDIKALRVAFEPLSKDFLRLAFGFGHLRSTPLFEAYCPMAFNNRGAAWLQDQDRRVHNAYFGAKMAYCGTIRRKFAPRKNPRRKK